MVAIVSFFAYIKFTHWPVARGQFNVWVNLPMMDPTRGDDLAKRMRRRSQINIGFGMVFLFAVLIFFKTVSVIFGNALFQDLIVLIWIIILWGGIPTTMIMRGMAMARLATEIKKNKHKAQQNRTCRRSSYVAFLTICVQMVRPVSKDSNPRTARDEQPFFINSTR